MPADGLMQRVWSAARVGAVVLRRTVRIPVALMSEALRRMRRGPAIATAAAALLANLPRALR